MHEKNLRCYGPGTPWYEKILKEQRIWHPVAVQPPTAEAEEVAVQPPKAGAEEESPSQADPDGAQVPDDLPWWAERRDDGLYCIACDRWATPEHLSTSKHLRRVDTSRQEDEATPLDPWIEVRDGCRYCLACRKFASPEHCATDSHQWRTQQWGAADIVVSDPFLEKRDDGVFCLACNKFATPEHLTTAKHLWRAQSWVAIGRASTDPGDILAVVVTQVPAATRKKKKGGSNDDQVLLEPCDAEAGGAPAAVSKGLFQAWPLFPRVGDVLLVAAAPTGDADPAGAQPRLKDACPLSAAELGTFARRLEASCGASPRESCAKMVTEYYPFVRYALQRATAADAVAPLLRVLKRVADEAVNDAEEGLSSSAVRVLLVDALRSETLGAAAPQLVEAGEIDCTLCQALAAALLRMVPSSLPRLRPLLRAACERRKSDLAQEHIPDIVEKEEFPAHWTTGPLNFGKQGWKACPLSEDDAVFEALQHALATDPFELGCDSLASQRGSYTRLVLKRAWRIENARLLEDYLCERQRLRRQCCDLELEALPKASFRHPLFQMPRLAIRQEVLDAFQGLPDDLAQDVNEVRLLAGARPEDTALLCREGLNPNATGGTFGRGVHLFEDAGRCDQNAFCDSTAKNKELKTQHSKLFTKSYQHPGNVYYVFVCRVVMGYFVRTRTAGKDATDIDGEGPVYASGDFRELAGIPGTQPPSPYQSLVVELGEQLRRYREFVQFDCHLVYPEYLMAYQRV